MGANSVGEGCWLEVGWYAFQRTHKFSFTAAIAQGRPVSLRGRMEVEVGGFVVGFEWAFAARHVSECF